MMREVSQSSSAGLGYVGMCGEEYPNGLSTQCRLDAKCGSSITPHRLAVAQRVSSSIALKASPLALELQHSLFHATEIVSSTCLRRKG